MILSLVLCKNYEKNLWCLVHERFVVVVCLVFCQSKKNVYVNKMSRISP